MDAVHQILGASDSEGKNGHGSARSVKHLSKRVR
jgi:hypothetical protein